MLGYNYSKGPIASVHVNGHDTTITVIVAKHCIKPPCDPKHVGAILNIFGCFIIILIIYANYIFVHLLDNKVF